jgi:hypothetical protein
MIIWLLTRSTIVSPLSQSRGFGAIILHYLLGILFHYFEEILQASFISFLHLQIQAELKALEALLAKFQLNNCFLCPIVEIAYEVSFSSLVWSLVWKQSSSAFLQKFSLCLCFYWVFLLSVFAF